MDRFADAATAICVERLGVNPDRAYDYTQDEVLQNELLNETLHPLFSEKHPDRGIAAPALFKLRRSCTRIRSQAVSCGSAGRI